MAVKFFKDASGFRAWLESNHKEGAELVLGFYKSSSGRPGITYREALDEALCFGWIDGVRRSINADAYTIRFTPRRPKSQWSAVNIGHAERLMKAGRMHPTGLKTFEGAKDQPRKYSYEQRHESRFSPADERLLRANRAAWAFFQSQPPWYRRTCAFWVVSAKKEETRQRRLATLIADSEHGKSVKPLARPVPKRR